MKRNIYAAIDYKTQNSIYFGSEFVHLNYNLFCIAMHLL